MPMTRNVMVSNPRVPPECDDDNSTGVLTRGMSFSCRLAWELHSARMVGAKPGRKGTSFRLHLLGPLAVRTPPGPARHWFGIAAAGSGARPGSPRAGLLPGPIRSRDLCTCARARFRRHHGQGSATARLRRSGAGRENASSVLRREKPYIVHAFPCACLPPPAARRRRAEELRSDKCSSATTAARVGTCVCVSHSGQKTLPARCFASGRASFFRCPLSSRVLFLSRTHLVLHEPHYLYRRLIPPPPQRTKGEKREKDAQLSPH